MAKKTSKSKLVIGKSVKPEIRDFVRRAILVCDRLNISHYTLSKRLFNDQARALENLASGGGANVNGYIEAKEKLAAYEAEAQPASAA